MTNEVLSKYSWRAAGGLQQQAHPAAPHHTFWARTLCREWPRVCRTSRRRPICQGAHGRRLPRLRSRRFAQPAGVPPWLAPLSSTTPPIGSMSSRRHRTNIAGIQAGWLAAVVSAPGFPAFVDCDGSQCQPDEGVEPPPAQCGGEGEADQYGGGLSGAEQVLDALACCRT